MKISVCMATYNGEKYIKQQLDSILPQIGADDEIVISDDGSTDGTIDIIHAMKDDRIRVIEGPHKGSPVPNFEHVLSAANGDIIFTADQDDIWHPDKVSITLQYLQKADCVVSDCRVVDSEENVISDSFFQVNHTKEGKWHNLLIHNGYLGCCMAFKKDLLEKALPFPPDTPQHDIWIGNVAAFKYSMVFIHEKLIDYRRHSGNASPTAGKSTSSLADKFNYRWAVIKGLFSVFWHI